MSSGVRSNFEHENQLQPGKDNIEEKLLTHGCVLLMSE